MYRFLFLLITSAAVAADKSYLATMIACEEKEEELLSEQLKKTKIEIYECWTHIVISIVTMLIAVVTAVLTWFK